MLESTTSSAIFSSSSLGPWRGDRGSAISPKWNFEVSGCSPLLELCVRYDYSPVRALSRIPNGAISFMKLSIRVGLAETSTTQLFVLISNTFPPN